jgi:hypothetical protein
MPRRAFLIGGNGTASPLASPHAAFSPKKHCDTISCRRRPRAGASRQRRGRRDERGRRRTIKACSQPLAHLPAADPAPRPVAAPT